MSCRISHSYLRTNFSSYVGIFFILLVALVPRCPEIILEAENLTEDFIYSKKIKNENLFLT